MICLKDTAIEGNIRRLMKDNDLTTHGFSKKTGISSQVISSVLSGNSKPRVATLITISEKFGVTLDWLCTERKI